jgi:GLPGLI family protein
LTINGYKSQKAKTSYGGRNYEAWFTTQIPIPDGPYKFCGLPGLIIKISDSKNHYVFELTDVLENKYRMSNLFSHSKPFYTDKKTFFKKLKESKDNAINKMAEMGFVVADESKQNVRKKMKAKNNPIELVFD